LIRVKLAIIAAPYDSGHYHSVSGLGLMPFSTQASLPTWSPRATTPPALRCAGLSDHDRSDIATAKLTPAITSSTFAC
jgi:hypothetical protein